MSLRLLPVFFVLASLLSSCAVFRSPLARKKYEKKLRKNAVVTTIANIERRLPEGKQFYAGVSSKAFKTGDRVEVVGHEILYWGIKEDRGYPLHMVKAKVGFRQLADRKKQKSKRVTERARRAEREGQREAKRRVKSRVIEYLFKEAPKRKTGLQLQFIYNYPKVEELSEKDPLFLFRKGSARRWLSVIRKKQIQKGMPEEALKLSKGVPRTLHSSKSMLGVIRTYIYGNQVIKVANGIVTEIKGTRD